MEETSAERRRKKSITGCPECGNLNFRLEEARANGHSLGLFMVKCEYCNNVVGLYDKSVSDLLFDIKDSLSAV
jgi:predicted nucleic-acid-binding Zn-ribbon protein